MTVYDSFCSTIFHNVLVVAVIFFNFVVNHMNLLSFVSKFVCFSEYIKKLEISLAVSVVFMLV